MPDEVSNRLTQLLAAVGEGDEAARQRLWGIVYDELHRLAHAQMGRELSGHTLQTTALVNEAYLRLTGGKEPSWTHRGHFFTAAAEAMRRICVDYARKRKAAKRGRGREPARLDGEPGRLDCEPAWLDRDPAEVLDVHDALTRLEAAAPRPAQVVKLRYFAGLSGDEIAAILEVSPRMVDFDWQFARTWLHHELSKGDTDVGREKGL
ncbi:MAG TPA: sigma-70 family RNA polymerase sigma factor [Phycisphaerae bacterium]|nr:sigma-70 family RNA polymerase sigma factor [Phycisphaerae bacterium]HNU46521.1 sigma-70 family RNA polymerase sigma factor [Phycisphaerae bacterium]